MACTSCGRKYTGNKSTPTKPARTGSRGYSIKKQRKKSPYGNAAQVVTPDESK